MVKKQVFDSHEYQLYKYTQTLSYYINLRFVCYIYIWKIFNMV